MAQIVKKQPPCQIYLVLLFIYNVGWIAPLAGMLGPPHCTQICSGFSSIRLCWFGYSILSPGCPSSAVPTGHHARLTPHPPGSHIRWCCWPMPVGICKQSHQDINTFHRLLSVSLECRKIHWNAMKMLTIKMWIWLEAQPVCALRQWLNLWWNLHW